MSCERDEKANNDDETKIENNCHILYEVLVDWYGRTNMNKPLSSTQLTDQWTTLWFAKREQQKLVDEKLMKYHSALEDFRHFQPTNLREKMSMIILYDQIPRNIYRGTEKAYQYDPIARRIALEILSNASLSTLSIEYLLTIIICLIHSEQIEHLELVENLIKKHLMTNPSIDSNLLNSLNGIVTNHYDRLKLFGRIPERNRFIHRQSTSAEIAFLNAVNTQDIF